MPTPRILPPLLEDLRSGRTESYSFAKQAQLGSGRNNAIRSLEPERYRPVIGIINLRIMDSKITRLVPNNRSVRGSPGRKSSHSPHCGGRLSRRRKSKNTTAPRTERSRFRLSHGPFASLYQRNSVTCQGGKTGRRDFISAPVQAGQKWPVFSRSRLSAPVHRAKKKPRWGGSGTADLDLFRVSRDDSLPANSKAYP